MGWEAMTPCLARLFEISLNNATISRDWKVATMFPIYKEAIYRQSQTIDPEV